MFRLLCVLSAALTFAACGSRSLENQSSNPSIVGGELVIASDPIVRSTVALLTPAGHTFCTGSLITSQLVVTAGHCLDGYEDSKLYVAFGTVSQAGSLSRDRLRAAKSYQVHESFSEAAMDSADAATIPNDIALLKLSEPAPSGFIPVTALTGSDALTVGEPLTLAGFGKTRWNSNDGGVLYQVTTKLTGVRDSMKEIEFGGRPGHSACNGDSGGPAFVTRSGHLVLVGVTSRGSKHCDERGIYTDVRQFSSWLNATATAL